MMDGRTSAAAEILERFKWEPQPEAERLVLDLVDEAVRRSDFLTNLQRRLRDEAGVRLADLVHSIGVPERPGLLDRLAAAGYVGRGSGTDHDPGDVPHFAQPGGIFPRIELDHSGGYSGDLTISIKVEFIPDFISVWQVPHTALTDRPLSPVRLYQVDTPGRLQVYLVELHGYGRVDVAAMPEVPPADRVLYHAERLKMRPRDWGDDRSFSATMDQIEAAIADLGVDYTCDLFFAAERDYWQRRNRAAQIQKARQDRLGIGWANHDHHTYRSSRRHFTKLVAIWEKLGFHCRERFYAGKEAGWGAQVMEQPNAGIVTFNDVDLSPDELLIDFAHEPLPERQQLGTVGLWCALHGESFLEAGMHHLECMFDFAALKVQLEQAGIGVMKPFTDFPYLRQAFTQGERWPVREERIAVLLQRRQITEEQAVKFRSEGAIGSHLENLERNQGFKGFNQTGVSEIIAATDPRKQLQ